MNPTSGTTAAPARPATLGRLAACAALTVLSVLGAAPGADAAEPVGAPASPTDGSSPGSQPLTWGVAPAGSGSRSTFEYVVDPGDVVDDVVVLSNLGEAPLTLAVYASDASPGADGGFDLLPAAQEPTDVGSWVDLGEPEVTIPARSRVEVPFHLEVPADASPGDHVGGIVAAHTAAADDSGQLGVERRVGARIYLRVSGTVDTSLAVASLRPAFRGVPLGQPGRVEVTYTVRNEGNVRLVAVPTVTVSGPGGLVPRTRTGDRLPEVLPGQEITATATVDGVWPLGPLDVEVDVLPVASGGQELGPGPEAGEGRARLWALPWLSLGAVAALAAAVAVRWRRRRRAARA